MMSHLEAGIMNKADSHQVGRVLTLEKVEHLVPRICSVIAWWKKYQGIKMVYSVLRPIAINFTFAYFRFLLDFGSTCRVLKRILKICLYACLQNSITTTTMSLCVFMVCLSKFNINISRQGLPSSSCGKSTKWMFWIWSCSFNLFIGLFWSLLLL